MIKKQEEINASKSSEEIVKMGLKIKTKDLDEIIRHCKKELPFEACGILVGIKDNDARVVEKIYKTKNILKSTSRYQIGPEEQLEIFLEADRNRLEVIGFYHSHPFYDAQVSAVDASSANYPGCVYLIYSIRDNEFKCFLWTGEKFELENFEEI